MGLPSTTRSTTWPTAWIWLWQSAFRASRESRPDPYSRMWRSDASGTTSGLTFALAQKHRPDTVHESESSLSTTSRETLMTAHNDKTEDSIPQLRLGVSRRDFLRAAGASAGLALVAACSYSSGPATPAAQPTPAAAGGPTAAPA